MKSITSPFRSLWHSILVSISLMLTVSAAESNPSAEQTKEWINLHLSETRPIYFISDAEPRYRTYVVTRLVERSQLEGPESMVADSSCELILYDHAFALYDGKVISEENFPGKVDSYEIIDTSFIHKKVTRISFPNNYELKLEREHEMYYEQYDGISVVFSGEGTNAYHLRRENVTDSDQEPMFVSANFDVSIKMLSRESAKRTVTALENLNLQCSQKEQEMRSLF